MKQLLLIAILVGITACTNESGFQEGKNQLEAQGYTNIRPSGFNAWCCGEGDTFSDGFTAIDPSGKLARGCFCSGWAKGVTIRFDYSNPSTPSNVTLPWETDPKAGPYY